MTLGACRVSLDPCVALTDLCVDVVDSDAAQLDAPVIPVGIRCLLKAAWAMMKDLFELFGSSVLLTSCACLIRGSTSLLSKLCLLMSVIHKSK